MSLVKFEKSEVTDESKYKNLKSLLKNNNIKKFFITLDLTLS